MKLDVSSERHSSVPERVTLYGKVFERYIEQSVIADAIGRMAAAIERDYAGREVVMLVVLKGAMMFAADLARALQLSLQLEFVRASSYGAAMTSSGTVTLDGSLEFVRNRHVLVIEDIADSGSTIRAICDHLREFAPASIAVATLLSKPAVHRGTIQLDYVGIEIEPVFVVGYGLDYNELGRNLADIYRLAEEG
ncbi:Hypoxanthine-guanine phosphoribosyltransferase [bacterium HR20]|nr:Hypoxanthine-guanine phosphoribosyltransferase [bacterium HR20]